MEAKFSPQVQNEIKNLRKLVSQWEDLFFIEVAYYLEGWALFLREKALFSRLIVIFKSYTKDYYDLKSIEILLDLEKKERYNELYKREKINQIDLVRELREVIYGKDLIEATSSLCKKLIS